MLLLKGRSFSLPNWVLSPPRFARFVVRRRPWGIRSVRFITTCSSSCPSSSARISSPLWEPLLTHCDRWKRIEVHCREISPNIQQHPYISESNSSRLPELAFDRLQLSDKELLKCQKHAFGRYVVCEAVLDEEYWTAAWLRAEAHCEAMSYMRHANSFKKKYAEQEFYELKRRCAGRDGNSMMCFCIVTVKKEDPNVRRTVLNSVVGTLDISIRQFMQGETLPGVTTKRAPILVSNTAGDANQYAYIANVCVSKFARCQGIATNMVQLATDISLSAGLEQLFVHVYADNRAAQDLYRKAGFEMVEKAPSPLSNKEMLLMVRNCQSERCLETKDAVG